MTDWFTNEDRAKAAIEIRRIYMQQIATTEGDSSFELDAASAALSAVNPYEWRPIESAPKTPKELREVYGDIFQDEIIVGRPNTPHGNGFILGCSTTATWRDGKWMKPVNPVLSDLLKEAWSEVVAPTHWKPLPAFPPSPEGDK